MFRFTFKCLLIFILFVVCANTMSAQVFTAVLNTKAGTNASCPDGFGNMYVGGIFADTTIIGGVPHVSAGDNDAWVGKYDASGNFMWSVTGGGPLYDKVYVLRSDNAGNVYGIIGFNDTMQWGGNTYTTNGGYDFLVTKISPTGTVLWSKVIGSPVDENGTYAYLDIDTNNDVHLLTYVQQGLLFVGSGATALANANYNLVRVKLSGASGNLLAVNNFGYSTNASIFAVNAMRTDHQGNIYAVYYSNAPSIFGGNSVLPGNVRGRVNANGSLSWVNTNSHEGARDIAVDNQGNMTITGDWDTQLDLGDTVLTQTVVSNDIFVVRYNNQGNRSWFQTFGGFQTDYGQYCLQDAQGNLIIVGIATGTVNMGSLAVNANGADFFVAKMDTAGNVLEAYSSQAANDEVLFSAGIDASGNLILTGGNMPPTSYGPFTFTDPMTQYFAWMIAGNACKSTGKIFRDFDNNGVISGIDAGLQGVVVAANPGNYYAISGQQGDYQIFSTPGNYTLSIPNMPLYYTLTTAATQTANFTSLGQVDTLNDFGIYPTPGIRDLQLHITSIVPAKPGHIAGYLISYKNVGTDTVTTGTLTVSYPSSLSFFTSYPLSSSSGTNNLTWSTGVLLPGETGAVQVYFTIPTSAVQGTVFIMPASITSPAIEQTPANNSINYHIVTVSSFDPNSKEVTPANVSAAYINNGGWFEYTIHFQNTGTDTAFNILIQDTLSSLLNMGTFELLNSTHPVTVSMKNGRIVEFLFQNVNLPDSNVNELKSHGAISFRIKANTPSPLTGSINNYAAIYFDYNAPVLTNNAKVKIGTSGIVNNNVLDHPMSVYPNPAKDEVNVFIPATIATDYNLLLTDLCGRVLTTYTIESGKTTSISISNLVSGLYFLQLNNNGVIEAVEKLMIVK